ncbi:MAG: SH3 domain-containing protein, partial [Chloroflexota bacterium]
PTFTPAPAEGVFIENSTEATAAAALEIAAAPATEEVAPVQEEPTATATLVVATEEPIPTEPPPPADPMVTILQNMNVRGGPSTQYSVIGAASPGNEARILGRNGDLSWVQVEYPSANGTGWVYAELVQISGDASTLPIVEVAPPPTPIPPTPVPEPVDTGPPPVSYQFTPGAWHASENASIVHFKGSIKDGAGNAVNGYSVKVDNWAWRAVSFPTGSGVWHPDQCNGCWDVVMPEIHVAQGWWWVSVVRYNCNYLGGFDSFCTEIETLSEEVKIQVVSPNESIINAEWVCHWDCDKGIKTWP